MVIVVDLVNQVVAATTVGIFRNVVENPTVQDVLKEGPKNESDDPEESRSPPADAHAQPPPEGRKHEGNPKHSRQRRMCAACPVENRILKKSHATFICKLAHYQMTRWAWAE